MKTRFWLLCLLFLFVVGCTKEEFVTLDLKGTIKGEITIYNELGHENFDFSGITFQLEGEGSVIPVEVRDDGSYQIDNVRTNTYKVTISKEGYGDIENQIRFVGGNSPVYFSYNLLEKSKTIVENLSAEFKDGNISLKGTIFHNYTNNYAPRIRYFLSSSSDINLKNYTYTNVAKVAVLSGESFEISIPLYAGIFPNGSTVYIIVCGIITSDCGFGVYVDNYYSTWGEPSNITMVTIP